MTPDYLAHHFGLTGRRILVVGGRGTVGTGIVQALGNAGAELYISSREPEPLTEAVTRYQAAGFDCRGGIAMDITCNRSIEQGLEDFKQHCPDNRLDGLIVNSGGNVPAAIISPNASFFDSNPEAGDEALRLNYSGVREVIRVFGPLLINGAAPVVSVTGSVAHLGLSRVLDYGAGKAALDRLVQFLGMHLMIDQEFPIRVNGVRVGFIFGTEKDAQNSFAQKDPGRYDAILQHIPMRRGATPAEIGNAFVFLQSKASSYVHGTMISVDGGWETNRLGAL